MDPMDVLGELGRKIFDVSTLRDSLVQLLAYIMPEFLSAFKIRLIRYELSELFSNIVKETVTYREKHGIIRHDFLHLLMELKIDGKLKDELQEDSLSKEFTLNHLIAQCYILFVAGFETSSGAITFCLYEIAANNSIQNKLRQEVETILAKYQGQITYEALMEMKYLDKCINETLRKYPPSPVYTRKCTKEYKIVNSNLVLEKGTHVSIPVLGIHRNQEYYPNPHYFDPERFSEENKKSRHSCAWMPFGEGPRTCIGIRFGMMQMKISVVALMKMYSFSLNSKMEGPLILNNRQSVSLGSHNDILLDVKKLS